jgi:hypothetical protein
MTRAWLLGAVLSACGTESYIPPSDGGGASCASRTGNYTAHFVERAGGTCGPLPDTVVASGTSTTCQGTIAPSADNCSVDLNQTCTVSGRSLKETGTSHWSQDGASGSAVITMTAYTPDGKPQCTSTYDVAYTKT